MPTQDVYGDFKWCSQCHKRLHVREFKANAALRSGLDSWCRSCHRTATKDWRAKVRAKRATAPQK